MKSEFKKIHITPYRDFRGGVEKIFQTDQPIEISQFLISLTSKKNTLRGLHCQIGEYAERKFIYCLSGSLTWFALDFGCLKNSEQVNFRSHNLSPGEAIEVAEYNINGMLSHADNTNVAIVASKPYSEDKGFHIDPRSIPELWNFVLTNIDGNLIFDETREYLTVTQFLEMYSKWKKI
jgi:dTDP-4-dehydrorhamnose 3,5-epimerase-like enzyme